MRILFYFWSSFCLRIVFSGNEIYRGDKLVAVELPTEQQQQKFTEYLKQAKPPIDVWSRTITHCDVQIKEDIYTTFINFCEQEKMKYKVCVTDMEKAVNNEKILNGLPPADGTFAYTRYNTNADITKELFRLQNRYPYLVRVHKVGYSFEGRPLWLVKVSLDVNGVGCEKPITWIDGGIHAREWISVAVTLFIMKEMIINSNEDAMKKLLTNNMFYFVPVFNPDGYEYTLTERLWRKTRTVLKNSTCLGVDANRNFDVQWGKGGGSTNPCDGDYQGEEPESEPCVASYANIMRWKQSNIKAYWNLHSFYQILFIPNSYTPVLPPQIEKLRSVAIKFLQAVPRRFQTFYGVWTYPALQNSIITGAAIDYVHDKLNVTYSFALELPPSEISNTDGFLLPPSKIEPTSLEVLDGILAVDKEIDRLEGIGSKRK